MEQRPRPDLREGSRRLDRRAALFLHEPGSAARRPSGGEAVYLLFANNAQSKENPRGLKHELIAAGTEVKVPAGGVIYDVFHGGAVPVTDGKARLRLAAGDGACWVHVPRPVAAGELQVLAVKETPAFDVTFHFNQDLCLPLRLRVFDPNGMLAEERYRAPTPDPFGGSRMLFHTRYPLGFNAAPGNWTVEVSEWLTGSKLTKTVAFRPQEEMAWRRSRPTRYRSTSTIVTASPSCSAATSSSRTTRGSTTTRSGCSASTRRSSPCSARTWQRRSWPTP